MKAIILALFTTSCASTHITRVVMTPIDGLLSSCANNPNVEIPGYQSIVCTFENQSDMATRFQLSHINLFNSTAKILSTEESNEIIQSWQTKKTHNNKDSRVGPTILNEPINISSALSVTRGFLVETKKPLVELSLCFKQYYECSRVSLLQSSKRN